eukprot:56242_1
MEVKCSCCLERVASDASGETVSHCLKTMECQGGWHDSCLNKIWSLMDGNSDALRVRCTVCEETSIFRRKPPSDQPRPSLDPSDQPRPQSDPSDQPRPQSDPSDQPR